MGYPGAQLGDPDVGRIAGHSPLDRLDSGLSRGGWGIEIRLADAEVQYVLSGGFPAFGLIAYRHRLGSLEVLDVQRQRVGHTSIHIMR